MSKGPGTIQRAIEATFTPDSNEIYTIEDLVAAAYPGLNRIEKKHRVSVIRAAEKACGRCGWWWFRRETPGQANVYFNKRSVFSYALARERSAAAFNDWTSARIQDALRGIGPWAPTLQKTRERMAPGGIYYLDVLYWKADLAGDIAARDEANHLRNEIAIKAGAQLSALLRA